MRFFKDEIAPRFAKEKIPFLFCEGDASDFMPEVDFSLEMMTIFMASQGSISYSSKGQTVTAGKDHIQFFMKDASLNIKGISPDYKSKGIIFSKDYWRENLLFIHPYLNLAVVNPALEVTPEQKAELTEYFTCVKLLIRDGVDENSPVIRSIFSGLFLRLGELYQEWANSFCHSSESLLFVDFCELLFKHYKKERTLNFYAEKLGISPSSLSSRIKKVVGYPAHTCIMRYTIIRLCAELGNTPKSIKELAIEYNFNDSPHLCRFFKSYVGESPMVYRMQTHQVQI